MGLENRPCKNNVELEDFLVSDYFNNTSILLKIKKIYEDGISADGVPFAAQYRNFKNAVILKKDGSYLVGENTIEETPQKEVSFLVSEYYSRKSILFRIERTSEWEVFAYGNRMSKIRHWRDCVILKPDGTYLVGEEVMKNSRNREP